MKLLLCKSCQDVIKLTYTSRTCECGKAGGRYLNDLDAEYFGSSAVPIGFANGSLVDAVFKQPEKGMGQTFTAFVIPKECPTFVKLD